MPWLEGILSYPSSCQKVGSQTHPFLVKEGGSSTCRAPPCSASLSVLFFCAALTLLLIIKPPANTALCFVLVTLWASHPSGWLFFFQQITLVASMDEWRRDQQMLLFQPVQEMAWRGSGVALGWLRDGLHVFGHYPFCQGVPACLPGLGTCM